MTSNPPDRTGFVKKENLLTILTNFGLKPGWLKELVEQKILPAPDKYGLPGGGSVSFFPAGTDRHLEQFLKERQRYKDELDRLKAAIVLGNSNGLSFLLPSAMSAWEEYIIDRALLDILQADNLEDLRRLLFGFDGTVEDFDSSRLWSYRRKDQFDPRAWTVYKKAMQIAPTGTTSTDIVRFGRFLIPRDALFDLVSGPAALHWGRGQFLSCFENDTALETFQSFVKSGLVDLISSDPEMQNSDLAKALRIEMSKSDYLYVPNESGSGNTEPLRRVRTIPFAVFVDAKKFVLGRLRHLRLLGADYATTTPTPLAQRFKVCPVCKKLYVRTWACGDVKTTQCGVCATHQRKRKRKNYDFAIDPDLI
jgi:hypothetical protein